MSAEITRASPATLASRLLARPRAFLALTKPRVVSLIVFTAVIGMLLATPGIRLYEFVQAEAYARRYPYLSQVTLARGVVDLSRNVPPRDVHMVAATCSLVAREGMGVLWATHLIDEIQPTDRIVLLHKGKVLFTGTVPAFVGAADAENVREAFRKLTGTTSTPAGEGDTE